MRIVSFLDAVRKIMWKCLKMHQNFALYTFNNADINAGVNIDMNQCTLALLIALHYCIFTPPYLYLHLCPHYALLDTCDTFINVEYVCATMQIYITVRIVVRMQYAVNNAFLLIFGDDKVFFFFFFA